MGWLGSALLVLGMIAVGYRRRWGFIVGGVGEAIWVVQAARTKQLDLLVVCIVFLFVYFHNYWMWGRARGPK